MFDMEMIQVNHKSIYNGTNRIVPCDTPYTPGSDREFNLKIPNEHRFLDRDNTELEFNQLRLYDFTDIEQIDI